MDEALTIHRHFFVGALIIFGFATLGLGTQGCQQLEQPTNQNAALVSTASVDTTPSPLLLSENLQPDLANHTATETSADIYQHVWENFQPPSIDPATPIPPPQKSLALDDEVLVWILLGTDTEPPFTGRTQAIHLLFIHPRLSKASLVSIPGDLYVYIPGYTMQRLNTAYPLGGIETLRKTLAYNFGVTPSRFVVAHPGDFQWLVDDIDHIEVSVFYPMPHACGGIPAGQVTMDGALALCYASYREGMDEIDRMRRQQQLMRVISRKITRDGNLIRLPILFASYEGWVKTDLSLEELMGYIPLALRLADPDRISYYMIGWDQITLWEVPGYSQAQVFLPDQNGVKMVLQQAIDDIMIPKPLTNQVQTLEAQLTAAYQATESSIPTPSPFVTFTPTSSSIPDPESLEEALTPTPPGYP
jgi:polyisoprenyl-teichoic acid--peptidoglycan teichoic acid transferase